MASILVAGPRCVLRVVHRTCDARVRRQSVERSLKRRRVPGGWVHQGHGACRRTRESQAPTASGCQVAAHPRQLRRGPRRRSRHPPGCRAAATGAPDRVSRLVLGVVEAPAGVPPALNHRAGDSAATPATRARPSDPVRSSAPYPPNGPAEQSDPRRVDRLLVREERQEVLGDEGAQVAPVGPGLPVVVATVDRGHGEGKSPSASRSARTSSARSPPPKTWSTWPPLPCSTTQTATSASPSGRTSAHFASRMPAPETVPRSTLTPDGTPSPPGASAHPTTTPAPASVSAPVRARSTARPTGGGAPFAGT